MSIRHILHISILTGALLWVSCNAALAAPVNYFVTINTSLLEGSGAFGLAFQLEDGSGTGDANNTVVLSHFTFGGGSAGAVDLTAGGAAGNMTSAITMTDSDPFFNAFAQNFTPGATLSFEATMTNNADVGAFDDMFLVSLLDGSGNGIPTLDPSGNDTLVTFTMSGKGAFPAEASWGTDTSQTAYHVAAPNVMTPEPGTWMLMSGGLLGLGLLRRRKLS